MYVVSQVQLLLSAVSFVHILRDMQESCCRVCTML